MTMGIFSIIGIILFLYLVWRNLKEDYKSEYLISYTWLALLGFFVGGRLTFGLINWGVWNESIWNWFNFWQFKGLNLIGGYLFLVLTTFLVSKYRNWKMWSFAEDSVNFFIVFIFFLLTDELISSKFNFKNILFLVILLIGFVLALWLKGKYRSFVWYKSGKKGFVFFAVNFLVFLLLSFVSLLFREQLIFSYLYLGGSLLSLIGLFILGDIWIIKR